MVSTLEFHDVPNHIFARSAADGSFDASLFSAPGATLQLRYNPFPSEDSPQEAFGFSPWPGALLRVPDSSQPALGRQFSASGSSGVAWTTEGTVSARDIGPAEPILVTGTLRLFIPEGVTPPPEIVVPLDFGVDLLFDEDGLQTAPGTDFVSRILSPQGLPIERNPGEISSAAVLQSGLVVVNHQGPVMRGPFTFSFTIPIEFRPGTYRLYAFLPAFEPRQLLPHPPLPMNHDILLGRPHDPTIGLIRYAPTASEDEPSHPVQHTRSRGERRCPEG